MARWFYTLLYYLILPLILLRLLIRAIKAPSYLHRISERFGFFSTPQLYKPIWIHAVSVGETIAAEPLIRQLQQRYPERSLIITTMTPTGSARVKALFGDTVFHVYAPYDFPGAVNRFLHSVLPSALIIMETELWPNTIHYCRRRGVPVLLANARLSAKSAAGYQKFSALTVPMLKNLSKVVAQTPADADRFKQLGLPEENVTVSGSIKFDIAVTDQLRKAASELKTQWGEERLVWIAASTHSGEDEILLQVFAQLQREFPQLLLLLVPRHPERFNSVVSLVQKQGFSVMRRSEQKKPAVETQIMVGDTMGELLLLYGVSDIAFVGGSLVERGGHNMLEAAAWQLPIITGSSDYNFLAISELLQRQGGLKKIGDADELLAQMQLWLRSPTERQAAGAAAAQVVTENRGALSRLLAEVESQLNS